jgi:molybdopterin/thiamine biosynthesis adenylyltransferase/rhodanese-related sulfurtransferase
MAQSYRDLLAAARARIREVTAEQLRAELAAGRPIALVDVREPGEWSGGHLPGALHLPRGLLESGVEAALPDRDAEVVIYCARGNRSALAADALQAMGYRRVASLAGGILRWRALGLPSERPEGGLAGDQRERYARHLVIPEVGEEGQRRLLGSRVLLLGAGGLGSPAALYLAAAGVGTVGIVDSDVVDLSNLQRQVIHSMRTLGLAKTASAAATIQGLNPDVAVRQIQERFTRDNAFSILDGWELALDCGDNFPTRYLLNDAAVAKGVPVIHGSVHRFEGQVTTFWPRRGPCYRCLFPAPPPADLAPSCAEAGVLGVLPGVVGLLQATEALKILLGRGETLVGRLLVFDALRTEFRHLRVKRDPACPVCRDGAAVQLADYERFCGTA